MKVLLLNPKTTMLFEETPLGILYIAAVIIKAGHSVELLDGNMQFLKKELDKKLENKPDVIGMTCTTLTYPLIMELSDYIDKICPNITIVIGGAHATLMPETLLKNTNIDFCVIGEGEETIVDLITGIERGYSEDCKGIAFRDQGNSKDEKVYFTPKREPISNLDSIPFPARDLLDSHYLKDKRTTMVTSRGCPGNCTYCQPTLRTMFGNKIRHRSPQNVVDELLEIYDKFNIRCVKFFDDTFASNRAWTFQLLDLIYENFQKKGKKLKLDCMTRVNLIDLDILKAMKRAGFYIINFGVESGSQKILNYYRKGITVEQTINAFKLCKEVGMGTHACLMIGAPIETLEDVKMTRRLLGKIKPDSICCSITTPLPYTSMWDDCIAEGKISREDWYKAGDYLQKWGGICDNISQEQLFRLKTSIQRNFWLKKACNPRVIFRLMRHHDKGWLYRTAKYFLWE